MANRILLRALGAATLITICFSPTVFGYEKTKETEISHQSISSSHQNEDHSHPLGRYKYHPVEKTVWQWYPWIRTKVTVTSDGSVVEEECVPSSSIDDFPDDLFTQAQRRQGAVILHFWGATYFFTILAMVVNGYFIPSIECICEDLKLSPDVAAATFMATATAMPELFTNTISIFVTESDMGLGNVLGSLMFNTLGVAAIGSLATIKPVTMNWWPITRDSLMFAINISLLTTFAWDGQIMWYEAMTMLLFTTFYYTVMFQNQRIKAFVCKYVEDRWHCCKVKSYDFEASPFDRKPKKDKVVTISTIHVAPPRFPRLSIKPADMVYTKEELEQKTFVSRVFKMPKGASKLRKFWWLYTWPIKAILAFTIPNPKLIRKLYGVTFLMCIIWIGINSYLVFWMLTIIGYTFKIPESVMGMTFLAAGGCTPEAITSVIMARRGEGAIGVSNSLGANSLAILLSLGLPWFVRTMVDGGGYTGAYVKIASNGMEWTIMSLLLVIGTLYLVISLAGYRLKKIVGIILFIAYAFFITFAVLVELDVFFPSGNLC